METMCYYTQSHFDLGDGPAELQIHYKIPLRFDLHLIQQQTISLFDRLIKVKHTLVCSDDMLEVVEHHVLTSLQQM